MNSRAAAWFAALIFLLVGIWCIWDGFHPHKGTKSRGMIMKVAGVAALAAGGYSLTAVRR